MKESENLKISERIGIDPNAISSYIIYSLWKEAKKVSGQSGLNEIFADRSFTLFPKLYVHPWHEFTIGKEKHCFNTIFAKKGFKIVRDDVNKRAFQRLFVLNLYLQPKFKFSLKWGL